MKHFFIALLLFAFSSSFCQTQKEIAKAIFDSFKRKDTSFIKYYIDDSSFKKSYRAEYVFIKNAVDSGRNSWKPVAKLYGLDSAVDSENSFVKAMVQKLRREELIKWQLIMESSKNCTTFQLANDGFNIVKDTVILQHESDRQLEFFMVIMDGKEKFALRYTVSAFNGQYYLLAIEKDILLRSSAGKFSCTLSCESNKQEIKVCD